MRQESTSKPRSKTPAHMNLKVALEHAYAGYAVFPARPDKRPYVKGWQQKASTDEHQIKRWFERWPDAMPGLPTGRRNKIAVLDIDKKNGKDGYAALSSLGVDPEALSHVQCSTPSGGSHFYFAWPEGMGNSASGLPPGVDVRGEGGFVIAAGAVSPKGTYVPCTTLAEDVLGLPRWPTKLARFDFEGRGNDKHPSISLAVLRSALLAIPNDNDDRDWWIKIGAALHFETGGSSEGAALWQEWSSEYARYDQVATEAAWKSFNRRSGQLVTGLTILSDARKNGWQDPSVLNELETLEQSFELDEEGVIRAFTAAHKDELCFDHSAGNWFQFDGNSWRRETTKLAHHYARDLATSMAEDDARVKALRRVHTWEAIERGARTAREFVVTSDRWNSDPWLLGTPAGTVELRTGLLRPGVPDEYISRLTKVAPVPLENFDGELDCPRWLEFLDQALDGDEEAIRFLRMWAGYSLTGVTKEQALVFVYGPGGAGKSTAINTIADILGDYAINVATSTLTTSKHDAHPEEIARMDGARLAWASETEKGRAWAENKIKSLTGGDKMTARFMRQNSFEFTPQIKLMIVGNNAPSLTNVDEAIKRRFIILPFDHPPKAKDPDLSEKLRIEWPGILSWMIAGCLDWQKNGLIRPEVAKRATDRYFDEQDVFAQWIAFCCDTDNLIADTASNLWASWSSFAYENGESPGNKIRGFPELLKQKGFERMKDSYGIRGRGYAGLRVRSESGEDDLDIL